MQLLEREPQLAALTEYAEQAAHGEGRLVLVAGEAGVGKSSLVEELARRRAGDSWFCGDCDGLSTPRPLGPLADVARQAGGELLDLVTAEASRDALFEATLRRFTGGEGLQVLVIEDAHWADGATLDLLSFLARRIRSARLLLLVTFRDDELAVDHPLSVRIGRLSTERVTRRISVPRLTAAAVEQLAEGSGLESGAVHRLTSGNPFFVHEVLGARSEDLPVSARDAVLARAAGLGVEARCLLDAASLTGRHSDLRALRAVAQADDAAVEQLLSVGLLRDESGMLRFRHEIARLAVAQTVPGHRRTDLHRRLLAALLAGGCTDEALLAHHADGAGDGAAVLTHAPRAAVEAADLGSLREAVRQYERALRYGDASDRALRADLLDRYADSLDLMDRGRDSVEVRRRAIDLWRDLGDPHREAESLRKTSRNMYYQCQGDEADRTALAAVQLLEPLPASPELARAYASLAGLHMVCGRNDEALQAARRAQELATQLHLADVLCDVLNTEGCVLASSGGDWRPSLDASLALAQEHHFTHIEARALLNLYNMSVAELRFAEGERFFVDGHRHNREHDLFAYDRCLHGTRVETFDLLGRWPEAMELCRQLLEGTDTSPANRLLPGMVLGRLLLRRGEPAGWALLEEALALATGLAEPQFLAPVHRSRAEAFHLEGRNDDAAREVAAALAVSPRCHPYERGACAVWAHRLGMAVPADGYPEPFARELAGDPTGAAGQWEDLGCPYEAAMALLAGGEEHSLRTALASFERLGAEAAARRARRALRELGVRSVPAGARAATRAHPCGLTRREQEVHDLVSAGLTDEEIARRLVLSTRTVHHHVSAVLRKLGVSSRREVPGLGGALPAARELGGALPALPVEDRQSAATT